MKNKKILVTNKMYEPLDNEDRKLIKDFENMKDHASILTPEMKKEIEQAAGNTLKELKKKRKTTKISIRIPEEDLLKTRERAEQDGLPYQTLISSVLHRFLNGNLIEKHGK